MKLHLTAIAAAVILLISSCRVNEISGINGTWYAVSENAISLTNSSIHHLTQPYRDSLEKSMGEILAYTAWGMSKELPEGRLGNYCSDACLRQVREICKDKKLPLPQICLLNHGGLRASFPSGAIRMGNVFEVMPFENELVMMKLRGIQLDSIIQFVAAKGGAPLSGLGFSLNQKTAVDIRVGGEEFSPESEYIIIASDFIATGGDGFPVMKDLTVKTNTGLKVRDALILDLKAHLNRGDTLKVNPDGRIKML